MHWGTKNLTHFMAIFALHQGQVLFPRDQSGRQFLSHRHKESFNLRVPAPSGPVILKHT